MRYEKTFKVTADPAYALGYVADFRTLVEWEPSVQTVQQTRGSGPCAGAVYQIKMRLFGQDSEMRYECMEYTGNYAILQGMGDGFSAFDRIDVRPVSGGCEVTYLTDISLLTKKGKMLEPLIALIFGFNVRHAVKNLRKCLTV